MTFRARSSAPVWLLRSFGYSAQLAAHLGLPFAFAAHLADENVELALALYRRKFSSSAVLDRIEMWNTKIMSRTRGQVVEKLNAWQRRLGAAEVMLLNLGDSPAAIHRSTEIIADAYMPEYHPDQDGPRYG